MTVQKTREVGVRKVLGASTINILFLFSKEFTLLIVFTFVIAAPTAHFFMYGWLQNFACRTNIGIETFLLTISMAVLEHGLRLLIVLSGQPLQELLIVCE